MNPLEASFDAFSPPNSARKAAKNTSAVEFFQDRSGFGVKPTPGPHASLRA
jgi:hypothetical protein